jgi:hypothetical protein
MVTAAHWYESSAFVGITGLVISVLAAVGTTVAAYRFAKPRRLILVDIPRARFSALEPSPQDWPDIFAAKTEHEFENLRLIRVQLRSKGRWDIATSAFDRHRPIVIDIGISILDMKSVQPADVPHLEAEIAGTELKIGPGLVRRRRRWNFTLLTDGPATCFKCVNPLTDVDILRNSQQRSRRRKSLIVTVLVYALITWLLYKLGVLAQIGDSLAAFFNSL